MGALVDGNDLFAVYQAASEAVARARAGGGPTVIEARTFRMSFHNTTDNPRRYRDPAVEQLAAEQDPIRRVEDYLAGRSLFDDDLRSRWQQELAAEIDGAIQAVTNFPRPGLDDVFEHGVRPPVVPDHKNDWGPDHAGHVAGLVEVALR